MKWNLINADIFRTKGEYCKLFISEKNIKITNQLIFHAFQAVPLN